MNAAKITKSYYNDHGGVVTESVTVKRQEKVYEIGMSLVVVERQTVMDVRW